MNIEVSKHVSEIVAEDYRTAAVFESHGIDFCCGGNITITQACSIAGIEPEKIVKLLTEVTSEKSEQQIDFQIFPLDLLADYIEKKHHRYVEEMIPVIREYLDTVCAAHGSAHPELLQISELFSQSADQLVMHMKKEELILFPFIRKIVSADQKNLKPEKPQFGTIENPIASMIDEHNNEGERFKKIANLSDNYDPPSEACNTYRVTFAYLKEFEKDLHLHIHLENNILFPKSIELEKRLFSNLRITN
jgi:regulator of cell morphogenesis and NO signaling